MDLSSITGRVKDLFGKRGGAEGLKQDAQEVADIARGEGSLSDKAREAFDAVKDPGVPGPEVSQPPVPGPGGAQPHEHGPDEPGGHPHEHGPDEPGAHPHEHGPDEPGPHTH